MWLYVPSASVPEGAALIWRSVWRFRTLARSVGWNGTCTQPRTWSKLCTKDGWIQRLCGQIYTPSTAAHGVARWIASLQDIPVNPSAMPEHVAVKQIRATCGQTWRALSRKWNPVYVCLRTSPATSLWDSMPSTPTLTEWASRLRLVCLARQKWARRINGSAFSLWPTAGANDHKGSAKPGQRRGQLDEAAEQLWKTPRTLTGGGESAERKQALGRTQSGGGDLQAQAESRHWPTPRAEDSESAGRRQSRGVDDTLTAASRSFSHPDPMMPPDGSPSWHAGKTMPRLWPTAAAMDAHDIPNGNPEERRKKGGCANLSQMVREGQDDLRLNPRFVAWLMGWPPIAEDGYGFWAMESSPYRGPMLSEPCWWHLMMREHLVHLMP